MLRFVLLITSHKFGKTCNATLIQHRSNLIVLDYSMPVLNGLEGDDQLKPPRKCARRSKQIVICLMAPDDDSFWEGLSRKVRLLFQPSDTVCPERSPGDSLSDDLRLWFGCDGNIDVRALFELHIIAMFIG
jgi:hypothetical protein